jgi:hypothetical protein
LQENNKAPHYTSYHSWFGITAMALMGCNAFGGIVTTVGKKMQWQWTDQYHRWAGTLGFLVTGAACCAGLVEKPYGVNVLGKNVAYGCVGAIVVMNVLLLTGGSTKAASKKTE